MGVVLLLVSAVIQGSAPKPGNPVGKVATFLVDNGDEIRCAAFIGALGSIVLLGWAGAVWRLAVLLRVMAIVGPSALGAGDTRALSLLALPPVGQPDRARSGRLGALHQRIRHRARRDRRAAARDGLAQRAGALEFLVAGGGIASTREVFFVAGFVAFLGFALWTLVVSVTMYRGDPRSSTAPSAT